MNKWILLIAMICGLVNLSAQEIESVRNRRDFTDYYFSPMKISRDHPLHASIFQIPLYSARSLANDTGILGASFEYTSIESSYTNNTFEYDFEGGLYRLNFDLHFSMRDKFDVMIRYDVSGVDGDSFRAIDDTNILRTDLKKSGSGNIDVLAKQLLYTFPESGIDLGIVLGCSIPIINTKTLSSSKNFDFGGGILATYQKELYAIHFNMGFVYTDDSTAFNDGADINYSVYGGVSVVGKIINKWYVVGQGSVQNPAFKSENSPSNVVGDLNVGVRYVYNSYITEIWFGSGFGEASHGLNAGFSFSLCF